MVAVFQIGEYGDDAAGNSTWSEGDWSCDGEFTTFDLVLAFRAGGFSRAASAPWSGSSDDRRFGHAN